jgi:hypothetical protein
MGTIQSLFHEASPLLAKGFRYMLFLAIQENPHSGRKCRERHQCSNGQIEQGSVPKLDPMAKS